MSQPGRRAGQLPGVVGGKMAEEKDSEQRGPSRLNASPLVATDSGRWHPRPQHA